MTHGHTRYKAREMHPILKPVMGPDNADLSDQQAELIQRELSVVPLQIGVGGVWGGTQPMRAGGVEVWGDLLQQLP